MREDTISPVYARILTRHLLRSGFTLDEVFDGVSTNLETLYANDEINLGCFKRILENGEALAPNPPIGFVIGSHNSTMALGPLGVAASSAPNPRAGLRVLEQYTRLHVSYMSVFMDAGVDFLELGFEIQGLDGAAYRQHVEATLMLLDWYLRTLNGGAVPGTSNKVKFSPPAHANCYSEYLSGETLFGQERNSVIIPSTFLDEPSPYFHRELWSQYQRQLSQRLQELSANDEKVFVSHVRAHLMSQPPPLPKLKELASQLHMSERTLNRRFQDEGYTYRELRGDVIDSWARRYLLQSDASVESIGGMLGYEDAANFRRAFRRRHGRAPSAFRRDGASI